MWVDAGGMMQVSMRLDVVCVIVMQVRSSCSSPRSSCSSPRSLEVALGDHPHEVLEGIVPTSAMLRGAHLARGRPSRLGQDSSQSAILHEICAIQSDWNRYMHVVCRAIGIATCMCYAKRLESLLAKRLESLDAVACLHSDWTRFT